MGTGGKKAGPHRLIAVIISRSFVRLLVSNGGHLWCLMSSVCRWLVRRDLRASADVAQWTCFLSVQQSRNIAKIIQMIGDAHLSVRRLMASSLFVTKICFKINQAHNCYNERISLEITYKIRLWIRGLYQALSNISNDYVAYNFLTELKKVGSIQYTWFEIYKINEI